MELTTTVRFAGADAATAALIAEQLDAALVAEIREQGVPTVKQYFVRPLGEAVQVGLRFEGADPEHVENAADFLLDAALRRIQEEHDDAAPGRRTSTLLVGA